MQEKPRKEELRLNFMQKYLINLTLIILEVLVIISLNLFNLEKMISLITSCLVYQKVNII